MCIRDRYNIDPCYYFSAPHFTFDAFLRHSNLTLELLSDVNQYLFIVKEIRGGMSMVSKRQLLISNSKLARLGMKSLITWTEKMLWHYLKLSSITVYFLFRESSTNNYTVLQWVLHES